MFSVTCEQPKEIQVGIQPRLHHTPSVSLAEKNKGKAERVRLSPPLLESPEKWLLFPDTFFEMEMTHSFSHTGDAMHCSLILLALPSARRDADCQAGTSIRRLCSHG